MKGSWWDCCTVAAARQSCPMIIMTTSTGPAEPCGLGCTPGIVLSKHAHTCITIGDPQLLFSRGTDLLIVSILVACSHKLSILVPISSPLLFLFSCFIFLMGANFPSSLLGGSPRHHYESGDRTFWLQTVYVDTAAWALHADCLPLVTISVFPLTTLPLLNTQPKTVTPHSSLGSHDISISILHTFFI